MYGAFLAGRLILAVAASVQSAVGIIQQFPACWTQLGIPFTFSAVQTYHLLYHGLLFLYASIVHWRL